MATIKGGKKFEAAMAELAQKLEGRQLNVGFLNGATYPDGTSVAFIAAMNEFGNGNAPPRPFFRRMVKEKSHEWAPAIGNLLVANKYNVDKTLNIAGEAIKGQLVQSINDLVSPPLAPSTIKRKGHAKPLIDTSVMVNSVGYEVKK
jgi:hypothetical protein